MPFTFPLPSRQRVTVERNPAIPQGVFDPEEGLYTKPQLDWFANLSLYLTNTASQPTQPVALTGQTTSISATPLPLSSVPEGLYRVSYWAAVTTAAPTSSSLTVAIQFPDNSVSQTLSGTAMTGNTTTTVQTNTWLIKCDNAGPIEYLTTYASVGGTMVYELYFAVETVANL